MRFKRMKNEKEEKIKQNDCLEISKRTCFDV